MWNANRAQVVPDSKILSNDNVGHYIETNQLHHGIRFVVDNCHDMPISMNNNTRRLMDHVLTKTIRDVQVIISQFVTRTLHFRPSHCRNHLDMWMTRIHVCFQPHHFHDHPRLGTHDYQGGDIDPTQHNIYTNLHTKSMLISTKPIVYGWLL